MKMTNLDSDAFVNGDYRAGHYGRNRRCAGPGSFLWGRLRLSVSCAVSTAATAMKTVLPRRLNPQPLVEKMFVATE